MSRLVSVVVPAFNSSRTLAQALDSVLIQDYDPLEIIVVDDASSDQTADVAAAYSDRGVRLVRLSQNGGASRARNVGLHAVRGEYVAFLDADDVWHAAKLRRQIDLLESNPGMSLATCDSVFADPSGKIVKRSHVQHPPTAGADAWKALLSHNFIPTPTVVARKTALEQAGDFDCSLPMAEDLDMWIRLALVGDVGVVPEIMVTIHDIPGSLSKRHVRNEQALLQPMLERYIREQGPRLSRAEIRAIYGRRNFAWGAFSYANSLHWDSAVFFARAALRGYRFFKSAINVPRSLVMGVVSAFLPGAAKG
jgi:glycosyltransferase involved in cell wall biosynthesis